MTATPTVDNPLPRPLTEDEKYRQIALDLAKYEARVAKCVHRPPKESDVEMCRLLRAALQEGERETA